MAAYPRTFKKDYTEPLPWPGNSHHQPLATYLRIRARLEVLEAVANQE